MNNFSLYDGITAFCAILAFISFLIFGNLWALIAAIWMIVYILKDK